MYGHPRFSVSARQVVRFPRDLVAALARFPRSGAGGGLAYVVSVAGPRVGPGTTYGNGARVSY